MNSNYIKLLIKTGIKAATGIAALAAAALILKSDNIGKSEQPKPEQPKPEKPTVPETAKSPADNSAFQNAKKPEKAAPQKSEPPQSDGLYPTTNDIYVPDSREAEKAKVPFIELTEKQAVEQGWSFQKKSKAVRITNYHGKERDIIIPSKIGGKCVNELSKRAFMHAKIDRVQIPKCIKKPAKSYSIGAPSVR